MSKFHELAVLPSCILAVDAQNGGSWFGPLRPPTPRVFSTSAHWPGFVSAFNSNGIKSYRFSIKFSLSEMPSRDRVLFGNQMALGEGRFMLVLSSKGKIQVQDESSWSGMVEHSISGTGKHTVTIEIAESAGRIIVDGVEYAVSVSRTAPILTVAFSNFPGTISSILLESDTSTLWQAAYSDLYEMSNPWPLPVPENFAEKAKAFYDCQAVVREVLDPTHDYSFLIDFKLDEAKTSGNVFYAIPSDAPFALILQSNNQIDFFTNLLKPNGDSNSFASIYAYYQSDVKLQGRHQIECKIEANMLSSYLDGVLVAQKTSNLERTGTATVGLPNCNSGYVYKIQITDLTDNQVVWSYPSDAERVRLITKTNIRTDRGYFEQADTTVNSYVNTALDLRGRVSSYTVFVDFYPAVFPESNNAECHQELAGQGGALIGSDFPPICSVGYYKAVDQTYHLQFAQQSGSLRRTVNVTPAAALSGRRRIVGVVDVQSSSTTLTLYLDGEQIGTSTYSGIPDGTAASIARCFSVAGVKEYGGWINYTGRVYSCLLFDRALSAVEIAALS